MLKHLIPGSLMLSSIVAVAGSMGSVEEFIPNAYVKLGSGGSYSMDSNIHATPLFWDAAPEGYKARLGQTALYSAAFGYNFTPLISTDIEFIYRPSYTYKKFQSSAAANTPQFVGDKTRYFNLESNSLMANVYFHGSGMSNKLKYELGQRYTIEPFIGAGLGVAFNTVSNFHSVATRIPFLTPGNRVPGPVVSILQDNLRTSIAWQLSAGLNLYNHDHFNLGAGYRYYNGETYSTNDYHVDWQAAVAPWKGDIAANEFFVTLSYQFNG